MDPQPPIRAARHRVQRAFTLIELLASMSVLALLMVIVVQMINSAMAVTGHSTRLMDADSQARLAFDRMAVDFNQIVKRQDVDYYFRKNGNGTPGLNDQMAFYSETSGYYPSGISVPQAKSNAALVGYRINNRQLERLSKALVWNGVNTSAVAEEMRFGQTLTTAWPLIADAGADPDYHVLGESVFRLEICFLLRNATTAARLSDVPYLGTTATPPPYNGLRDVAAVVVSLAVLDDSSRLIVRPADLDAAAAKLDDVTTASLNVTPPAVAATPAQLWQHHIDNGDLVGSAGTGLPKAAASQVRIYERYFYLGNAQ